MPEPLRIFISSTRADLMQYREVASGVIQKLRRDNQSKCQIIEVSMEDAVQTGKREYPVALSMKWVEGADWVVLIVGWYSGTITDEEGADGKAVTEWEYRHAMRKHKPCFVFLAGEEGTPDEYRALPNERVNLSNSFQRLSAEQATKLKSFRQELIEAHAGFFKNIDDFEAKLERTLRDRIDKLPPPVDPKSELAKLILAVEKPIHECLVSITTLQRYKQIHDALHVVRQEVIRPMREKVMSAWIAAGRLSTANSNLLNKLDKKAEARMAEIRIWFAQNEMGATPELGKALENIHAKLPIWDPPTEEDTPASEPDPQLFADQLDELGREVQRAFTRANTVMMKQNRSFDRLHAALLEEISATRMKHVLRSDEDLTLDDELQKVKRNADDLANSLGAHSHWQSLHDDFENLQGFRDTNVFTRRLKSFFDQLRDPLLQRAREVLAFARENPVENRELCEEVPRLEKTLLAWTSPDDVQQFDAVRAAFDDSFFKVDKHTLTVVNASSTRVQGFDELLRRLHKTHNN
jgi:Domain of unknown function (DUF4062)